MPTNLFLSPFIRETVADWNNRGGDCLRRGDLVRALDCFREAHSQLSVSHRSATAKAVGDSEQDTTSTSTSSRVSAPPSTTRTTDLTFIPDEITKPYQLPSITTVYTEVIPIPTGKGSFASDQSPEYFYMCSSSCILFNVALIYHLDAMMEVNCRKRQQQMLQAQSLYDKCVRLIFAQGIEYCVSRHHPILDLLSMAVLNNYAHIGYELCEFEKTKKYSDCLKYVASLIDPSIYGNKEVEAVILLAKRTFCLNMLFALQPPIVAKAA
jgi:hypothetical protein